MTTYTINRFQTVELPTFNPNWRELCERCVRSTAASPGKPSTPKVMRCAAGGGRQGPGGAPACSEVRHTICANGELFRERIA